MTGDDLRTLLKRRPFQPFRLYVDDGSAYAIRHPGLLLVARDTAVIGIPPVSAPEADRADDFAWVSLDHVRRVEPLDATPA